MRYALRMTVEKRCMIQPEDLIAIEVHCQHCKARVGYSIESKRPSPEVCPSCKGPLFEIAAGHWDALKNLHDAIAGLQARKLTNVRLEIRGFE